MITARQIEACIADYLRREGLAVSNGFFTATTIDDLPLESMAHIIGLEDDITIDVSISRLADAIIDEMGK